MKSRVFWITLGGALLTTCAVCWAVWAFLLEPLDRAVKQASIMKEAFVEALQITPRISVNKAVVFAQNAPTLELVTVERPALVRYAFTNTWMGSTKEFEVEATFRARAGFLLRDEFAINIPRGAKTAEIRLPRAKILSMEMSDFRILKDEDGLWNKLKAKDRESAVKNLEKEARKSFAATDLLEVARREGREKIEAIVATTGAKAVFPEPTAEPQG